MTKTALVVTLLALAGSAALHAQARPAVNPPARNAASVYGLMYTNISNVQDPEHGLWVFDDNAFGLGATVTREFGTGLLLGADVTWARPKYERHEGSARLGSGDASLATAMLTGRIAYGGAAELGFYLTGGLGTIAYNLPDVGGWNTDFALRAGTGIEYRFQPRAGVFLEWGRLWGYHEREGVGGGRQQHSQLKLGGRFAF